MEVLAFFIKTSLLFQFLCALIFKSIVGIHAFEVVYAAYRCTVLELNMITSIKWLFNVAFNGWFVLKYLHNPEKYIKIE